MDTWQDGTWVHLISLDTYPQNIVGKIVHQTVNWDVDKGTLLDVEDDKVFLNRKQIGRVLDKKDGKSIRVSTSVDIKYTGGYSLVLTLMPFPSFFSDTLPIGFLLRNTL